MSVPFLNTLPTGKNKIKQNLQWLEFKYLKNVYYMLDFGLRNLKE